MTLVQQQQQQLSKAIFDSARSIMRSSSSLGSQHHQSIIRLTWPPLNVEPQTQAQQQQQQQQQQKSLKQQKLQSGNRRSSSTKVLPKQLNNGQEVFVCPLCDQNGRQVLARSKIELTAHLRTHNRISEAAGQHRCAICSKELSSQSSLDRHMLTHSDERPFACPLCPTAFTTNGNMRRHMQTHRTDPALADQVEQHLNGDGRRRGRRPADVSGSSAAAAAAGYEADEHDLYDDSQEAVAEEKVKAVDAVEHMAESGAAPQVDWLAFALERFKQQQQQQQQQRTPAFSTVSGDEQPLDLTIGKGASAPSMPQQPPRPSLSMQLPQSGQPGSAAVAAAAAAAAAAACLPWPWSLQHLSAFNPHAQQLWFPALQQQQQQQQKSDKAPTPQSSFQQTTPKGFGDSSSSSGDANSERSHNSDDTLGDLSDGVDIDIDVDVDMDDAQRLELAAEAAARRKSRKNSYKDAPNLIYCPFEACRQAFPWMSSLKRHIITHTSHKPYACTRCEHAFSTKSNRERHMERIHQVRVKGRQQCLAHLDQAELAAFREHDRVAEDIGDRLLAELGHAVVTSANPHRVGGGITGGAVVRLDQDTLAGLSDSCSSR